MKEKIFVVATVCMALLTSIAIAQGSQRDLVNRISDDSKADDTGFSPEGVQNVVDANNLFALELYNQLREADKDRNTFISPFSISAALAITYEGAKGKTAQEMQSVLHFLEEENLRRPNFARIINEINEKGKSYTLSTANALWAHKGYPFLEEYLEVAKRYYSAKVSNLDFVNETEQSRQVINRWVEEQTRDKIKELLKEGDIKPSTRLVITNAIYFKGDWKLRFDEKETEEEDFRTNTGKIVKVPMMRMYDKELPYAETDRLQVLELPYNGEGLSMLILLPKEGSSLEELEESVSPKELDELRKALVKERVDVYLPKFRLEERYDLAEALKKMGMPTAFSLGADFSGMNGSDKLFIDKVVHQALVEVNEEGTEAAAATAVIIIEALSPPPAQFRADHPFLFIIQQRKTGNILFLGSVVNPKP